MSIKDIAIGRGNANKKCMGGALRIATGHSSRVGYTNLVKNDFEPELKKRVEAPILRHSVITGVKAYKGRNECKKGNSV